MTTRQFLTSAWDWNPSVLGLMVASLLAYAWAFGLRSRRALFLMIGLAVFGIALISPIDSLANGYLFSAHMLQHLVLLLIVPPLLLLSAPPSPAKREPGLLQKTLGRPMLGWLAGLGAMWIWHTPALCNASVQNPMIHRFQYASLLVMGTMFWWPILGIHKDRRLSPLPGVGYLFSACLGCAVLGIILTFAPVSVCSIYLHPVDRLGIMPLIRNGWGFTPAQDQQLGGLLMWIPACFVYLGGILGMLSRWYYPSALPVPPQPAVKDRSSSAPPHPVPEKL